MVLPRDESYHHWPGQSKQNKRPSSVPPDKQAFFLWKKKKKTERDELALKLRPTACRSVLCSVPVMNEDLVRVFAEAGVLSRIFKHPQTPT